MLETDLHIQLKEFNAAHLGTVLTLTHKQHPKLVAQAFLINPVQWLVLYPMDARTQYLASDICYAQPNSNLLEEQLIKSCHTQDENLVFPNDYQLDRANSYCKELDEERMDKILRRYQEFNSKENNADFELSHLEWNSFR